MKLNRLDSEINRDNRNKLNENMTIIEHDVSNMEIDVKSYKAIAEDNKRLVGEANLNAEEAKKISESVQKQLDTLVIEGDSSVEAAQARTNTDTGETYINLRTRLDEENKDVIQQLEQLETSKAPLTEVQRLEVEKAPVTEIQRLDLEKASVVDMNLKMDQTVAFDELQKKRNVVDKVEPVDLSPETLSLITGGTVDLETIPQANSVDKTKVINGEITLEKTTVDIFSHNINDWTIYRYNYTVGSQRTINTYNNLGVHYRHDTRELRAISPGTKIFVTEKGAYQVAIVEYDIDKKVIKDNGYKTGEIVTTANTYHISFVCSTKDYSHVSLETMLSSASITMEIPLHDYSKLNEVVTSMDNDNSKTNLVLLNKENWENGSYSAASGYDDSTTRIRYKQGEYINSKGITRIYYNVPDGYKFFYVGLRENLTYFSASTFVTGNGYLYLRDDIAYMIPILANSADTIISVSVLENLYLTVAEDETEFNFSSTDVTEAIKKIYNVENKFNLSDKVRYAGHAGMEHYGPENTLEAYRLSTFAGMWGAECDLGITSDKRLVLMHDYTVDRTTDGIGIVSSMTLAQIKALTVDTGLRGFTNVKVPTIEEFLTECKKLNLVPVIEVKQDGHTTGMVDVLMPILERYNLIDDCLLMSFGLDTIRYIRRKNSRIKLAWLLNVGTTVANTHLLTVLGIGNCTVAAYREGYTSSIINRFHEKGLPVVAWTVNDEVMADDLINIGVDIIVTNGLINPMRDRKIISTSITTTDNGATWTNNTSKLRQSATVAVEDGSIVITFDGFNKQAIANFLPTVKAFDWTARKSRCLDILAYHDSNGRIILNVYNNGTYVNSGNLPNAYNNLYVEVVF